MAAICRQRGSAIVERLFFIVIEGHFTREQTSNKHQLEGAIGK